MEISSNFTPLNSSLYSNKERWNHAQLGFQIDSHTIESFPKLNYSEIVIFNVPDYEGTDNINSEDDCKIRDSLYRLYFENSPKIADLGTLNLMNSRKENFNLITEVCADLIDKGIIPIVVGGGHDISYTMCTRAYVSLKKNITFCSVDSTFDIGTNEDKLRSNSFLSKIISYKPNFLFNFINIGYQIFFVKPDEIKLLENLNFELNRLGDVKKNLHNVEPLLRNSDFLSFDMSSIRSSFVSNLYSTPNGFDGEEACRIARYVGISDKITCFGIFEYNQFLDKLNQGSQLISQMIWYFLEGYKSRKHELIQIQIIV